MRILFLTPQVPYPPQQGTAIRNYRLISGAAQKHEVTLLAFQERGQPDPRQGPLANLCRSIDVVPAPGRNQLRRLFDLLFSRQADMARRLAAAAFRERLRARLAGEEFDLVQIEGIEMSPYLKTIRSLSARPAIVYDAHNAEYVLQERAYATDQRQVGRWFAAQYSAIQSRRLRRYEAHLCARVDTVLTVSDEDRAALQALQPILNPVVIPNGIDIDEYAMPWTTSQSAEWHKSPWALVFTGKMDFRPNVDAMLWFAKRILPQVQAVIPTIRLAIVGKNPSRSLNALRRVPGIDLIGQVPDVRPYISAAQVYIAPLRMGGGTRFKLLEAMAMGKPIVSTALGAEGFPVTSGQQMTLADEPQVFAREIIALLRDQPYRERLGRAARAFVESRYDWRLILPKLEEVYEELMPLRDTELRNEVEAGEAEHLPDEVDEPHGANEQAP